MVAAWIKADTGVGPSMASGNHVWRPICDDFPTAPTKRRQAIHVSWSTSKLKNSKVSFAYRGAQAKIVSNSTDWKTTKHAKIPNPNPKSPTRFIMKAFNAARFAVIREYQKLIRRYEHRPTPSHPKNNWRKLSAVIKVNMKKVKNERYAMNRGRWGSPLI